MSDEHDDDGLSHLFGPPGETGKIPQPPRPEPEPAADPAPEAAPEPAPAPAPLPPQQPEQPQPFSWDQVQPSWEQPTTVLPAQDLPDAAPAAPAEPPAAAPDPLAWLHADPAGAIPAAQPTSPTIPFTDQPTSAFTVPPYGTAQPDPFGAGAAAAALGAAPAEDFATRRYEQQPPAPPAAGGGSGDEPSTPGNRRLLIILGSVGAVLLIAIVILSIVLLTRGQPTAAPTKSATTTPTASSTPTRSSTPSPSPTPSSASPTPSPTPSKTTAPPAPPVPASPTVSASVGTVPDCSLLGATTATFSITYSSANATSIQLLSPSGAVSQTVSPGQSFQPVEYTCADKTEDWKVVATGDSAAKPPTASTTVTVTPKTPAVGQ
jgi:hypothetical protein